MQYIRDHYNLPQLRKGTRVTVYDGRQGRVTGSRSAYVLVRLDGEKRSFPYHPTWKITYSF